MGDADGVQSGPPVPTESNPLMYPLCLLGLPSHGLERSSYHMVLQPPEASLELETATVEVRSRHNP
jgi:hypothetical protein